MCLLLAFVFSLLARSYAKKKKFSIGTVFVAVRCRRHQRHHLNFSFSLILQYIISKLKYVTHAFAE